MLWRDCECDSIFLYFLWPQVTAVPGLRRNDVREIRARYPNFDPELDSVIDGELHVHDGQDGWITQTTSWVSALC